MSDLNPVNQASARSAIEHYVESYWASHPEEVTKLSGTIYTATMWIGRQYTVTRNALNALVREGKCTRGRWSDGTYQYTFARPVEVSAEVEVTV